MTKTMTFENACILLNTSPARSNEYLNQYAKSKLASFTTKTPLRYKVAATTIIRTLQEYAEFIADINE